MKKIIAIVIVIFSVWIVAAFPHLMINPGELVLAHQDIKEKCTDCHEPFWGISSEKCKNCHKLSEIGKDSSAKSSSVLFHNNLGNSECTSCHTDHHGVKPSVSLSRFDHNFLSVGEQTKCNDCHVKPIDKIHDQVSSSCKSCHNTIGWKSSVAFNHNLIQGADKNNCLSCHGKPADSFHSTLTQNCSACHTTEKWVPSSFDHSGYFLLDENHNANCTTCHSNNEFNAYTCYGCHEHSLNNIQAEHNEEGIYNLYDCASCHRSGNEHDIRQGGESNGNLNQNKAGELKNYIKSIDKKGGKKSDEGNKEDDD